VNHARRARLTVLLGDGWAQYESRLPNADMLGTVDFRGQTGALIRRHVDGVYCLALHGRIVALPAHKVASAVT
jgi:hypothetical protein